MHTKTSSLVGDLSQQHWHKRCVSILVLSTLFTLRTIQIHLRFIWFGFISLSIQSDSVFQDTSTLLAGLSRRCRPYRISWNFSASWWASSSLRTRATRGLRICLRKRLYSDDRLGVLECSGCLDDEQWRTKRDWDWVSFAILINVNIGYTCRTTSCSAAGSNCSWTEPKREVAFQKSPDILQISCRSYSPVPCSAMHMQCPCCWQGVRYTPVAGFSGWDGGADDPGAKQHGGSLQILQQIPKVPKAFLFLVRQAIKRPLGLSWEHIRTVIFMEHVWWFLWILMDLVANMSTRISCVNTWSRLSSEQHQVVWCPLAPQEPPRWQSRSAYVIQPRAACGDTMLLLT